MNQQRVVNVDPEGFALIVSDSTRAGSKARRAAASGRYSSITLALRQALIIDIACLDRFKPSAPPAIHRRLQGRSAISGPSSSRLRLQPQFKRFVGPSLCRRAYIGASASRVGRGICISDCAATKTRRHIKSLGAKAQPEFGPISIVADVDVEWRLVVSHLQVFCGNSCRQVLNKVKLLAPGPIWRSIRSLPSALSCAVWFPAVANRSIYKKHECRSSSAGVDIVDAAQAQANALSGRFPLQSPAAPRWPDLHPVRCARPSHYTGWEIPVRCGARFIKSTASPLRTNDKVRGITSQRFRLSRPPLLISAHLSTP